MKKIFYITFALLTFFTFSQFAQADVLSYTPSSVNINYGYGSALSRINDGNISTSGNNDYQVHPTNAIGKTITMTFNDVVNVTDVEFYNRISCCTNRIGGAQMIFKDETGVIMYTYNFVAGNNPALVTISDPTGDIVNVKTIELTNFQQNNQNFREIIVNGEVVTPTTLRITEAEYDSIQTGNDGTYEWIELYNYGSEPIDLENWTLTDANPTTVTLPSLVIPADSYVVLANNPTNFQINYPSVTADIDLSPTLGLSNAGDTLTLRNMVGDDIDFVAWEGAAAGWDLATAADAGESICRADNNIDTDMPGDFIVCSTPSPQSDDTDAPITPITPPDLTTDTGDNTTDNITNEINPSFNLVCTESFSEITVYESSNILGTANCTSPGTVSVIAPGFSDGSYVISYTETDQFGNESLASPELTIVVDTTSPDISLFTADTQGSFSVDSPNLEFTATDTGSGIFQYEISIDGEAFTVQSSPYNPTITPAASHSVILRATDIAGNQSTSTIEFPPVVSINSPTTSSNTTILDGTVTVTGPNNITSVTISANASNLDCGVLPQPSPVSCSFQVESTGTLTVFAEDTSGATGSASRDYIIDDVPPVMTFLDDAELGPIASDILSVNVSEQNFMTFYDYGFSSDALCDATDIFSETFSSRESLVFDTEDHNGEYVCFRAIDSFGNTSYVSSTNPLNIDVTAPDAPIVDAPTENPISGTAEAGTIITMETASGSTCTTTVETDGTWSCILAPEPVPGEDYFAFATDSLNNISNQTTGTIFKEESNSRRGGSRRVSKAIVDKIFGNESESLDQEVSRPEETTAEPIDCRINYYRLIKKGMRGEDVRQVQTCMNALGYTSGPEDGIYGPLTYIGITSYQRDKNLVYIDGIVGPETSGSLNSLSNVVIDKLL